MESFYVDLAITVLLSTIKQAVKNEQSKAKLKRAMLKVFNSIKLLYADDPDFQ